VTGDDCMQRPSLVMRQSGKAESGKGKVPFLYFRIWRTHSLAHSQAKRVSSAVGIRLFRTETPDSSAGLTPKRAV
jgi:hypothetical protein